LAGPLFELRRKDVAFVWNVGYEQAYQALKAALVDAPVLTRPNFKQTFWLDLDWSPKGVGAILSQKEGKFERVIAYANKSLTEAQKRFHPMEGECYALIWGVMHFRQYLHMKHFILRTDHKPLEWLATVSDAHGRRGRWVGMLQDFSFKIVHRPGLRHTNVDALSRNPIGSVADDDDFGEEIQDIADTQIDVPRKEGGLLYVKTEEETKWMGVRKKGKSDDEEDHGVKSSCVDIWEDTYCLTLLKEGVLPDAVDLKRARGLGRGQATIIGRSKSFSSKRYLCPNLRRGCLW